MQYTVRPGDTLTAIAARNNTTVAALLRANPAIKDPNFIRSGQRISIPVPGPPPSSPPAAVPRSTSTLVVEDLVSRIDVAFMEVVRRAKELFDGLFDRSSSGKSTVTWCPAPPPARQIADMNSTPVEPLTPPRSELGDDDFNPDWPDEQKIAYWKPHVMETQRQTGIPWQVILGQFGHEARYGRNIPSGSFNVFGVTADGETDPEKYVIAQTAEGSGTVRDRKFRKYQSYAESFQDHTAVLQLPFYSKAMDFKEDPYQYLAMIWVGNVSAGYATDPYYVEKVAQYVYELGTGREASVNYRNDIDTKLGGSVLHVVPAGEFAQVLQERIYGDPIIKEHLVKRHRFLYSEPWNYPKHIYMNEEAIDVSRE